MKNEKNEVSADRDLPTERNPAPAGETDRHADDRGSSRTPTPTDNPPVKNRRFLTAPFAQGGFWRAEASCPAGYCVGWYAIKTQKETTAAGRLFLQLLPITGDAVGACGRKTCRWHVFTRRKVIPPAGEMSAKLTKGGRDAPRFSELREEAGNRSGATRA